jgi:hypothetical protein
MKMKTSMKRCVAIALSVPVFALLSKSAIAEDEYCKGKLDFFRTLFVGYTNEGGQCGANFLRYGCSGGTYHEFTYTIRMMKCV